MDQLLFSMVIPTFNYGRFLGRAIDSALAQAGDDYEVIVVDDGSTDDTPGVAAAYGSRIRYVRQERQGVFLACKRGLNESYGRFLVYFDADDALTPEALTHFRREIDRRPDVGLVAGRHVTVTPAGRRYSPPLGLGKSRTANFRSFLLGRQVICTGASAIRREAVDLLRRSYDGELRVGMETACVAQALWFYDAVAVDRVLLEVYEHPGRLRDNLAEIRLAGEALVDAVFHGDILPPEAARYRKLFRARLLRDRSRSYHKAGCHADAVHYFHEALRSDPRRTLLDGRNLRRYLISRMRRRLRRRPTPEIEPRPSREPGVVEASGRQRLWGHRRRLRTRPHEFLRRCSTLGDVVKLDLSQPTYLLSNPRDVLHVFVDQPGRYRRTGLQAAFRMLFGRGLFAPGRSHIDQRRVIQPLLHRGRLDGFLPPLRQTLAEFLPSWRNGQTLEANGTLMDVTLRAAGRMILGLQRAEDAAELFSAIHGSHQRVVRNMQSTVRLPEWLPTKRNRTLKSHIARVDAVMRRLIDDARSSEPDDSLLSQLVHLRDSGGAALDDGEIRDHAATIFLAAYEPPATALTWMLHLVAQRPDVQQKLQAEIDAHAQAPPAVDQQGAAALLQRPYMSQVVSETVRLYPSTWLLTRRAAEPDALPSGARIPQGAEVLASPLLVHRDRRHYDRPNEFRPERFASGPTERRAAGTFFPFGLGPTACLGEYLARLMIGVTLEAILGRFTLESCDDDAPQIYSTNLFTMQPDRSIRVRLTARSTAGAQSGAAA